jgi:hypothetical protein
VLKVVRGNRAIGSDGNGVQGVERWAPLAMDDVRQKGAGYTDPVRELGLCFLPAYKPQA